MATKVGLLGQVVPTCPCCRGMLRRVTVQDEAPLECARCGHLPDDHPAGLCPDQGDRPQELVAADTFVPSRRPRPRVTLVCDVHREVKPVWVDRFEKEEE